MENLIIGGLPKSGTSFLVKVLNTHNKISVSNENYFYGNINYNDLSLQYSNGWKDHINNKYLSNSFKDINKITKQALSNHFPNKCLFYGDKVPSYARHLDKIETIYDDTTFLVLDRDPLQNIERYSNSYLFSNPWFFTNGDYNKAYDIVKDSYDVFKEEIKKVSNVGVISSDNLFLQLDKTMQEVASFLKIEPSWNLRKVEVNYKRLFKSINYNFRRNKIEELYNSRLVNTFPDKTINSFT
jgi:hypothetical protein